METALPTLRRRILRSFSLLLGIYILFGAFLVMSVNIASKTTPTLLHVNYDSIAAARRMTEAWSALRFPQYFGSKSAEVWTKQFEESLRFEEGNITEPGERDIALKIRNSWEQAKAEHTRVTPEQFDAMNEELESLVSVNEKGMFKLAQDNLQLSREVLIGSIIYFLISLALSVLFADQIAARLSFPLKSIAESLHMRPQVSRRLKLPEPTSLELLILTTELQRLWERLGDTEKVNVSQLVQQKAKLETVLEAVEDGLVVIMPNGRVSHSNGCFQRLVGISKEGLDGKLWMDLPTANSNYMKLREILDEGLRDGQQVELNWEGANAFFAARSRKLKESGSALYLLHDITEKKQREKFRSEFIDLLSHELKTPLQSMGTASELLFARKEELSPESRELVDTLVEDVERVRAVAQEFVQITQSQSKIMKLKLETIPINERLPEWIKPFRILARDRKVKIEYRQEGSDVIWANVDLVKFPWVVSNLLSNAVRFSPENGLVSILLTDRNGSVEIQVKDQGPGVSEADRVRIFEPFYQSGSATQRGFFGLGLTIAREVVEAHDGRIEYYPMQPGSEFRVLLPFPPVQYKESPERGETKSWTH